MLRSKLAPLSLFGLLLAGVIGCSPSELLGPEAPQGIAGLVLIGPQCPVPTQANPCPDLPYAAAIEVRTRSGSSVTLVRSDPDGRFRVGLRAGDYTLHPESGNPFPVASPLDVTVEDGAYTQVTVQFDTGIR